MAGAVNGVMCMDGVSTSITVSMSVLHLVLRRWMWGIVRRFLGHVRLWEDVILLATL